LQKFAGQRDQSSAYALRFHAGVVILAFEETVIGPVAVPQDAERRLDESIL